MEPVEKNIVVVGGGTGVFTVLSSLKNYPHSLTAIVSMADDGGSSGVLREEFGILPPGDIRRALVALSRHPEKFLANLFNYRFEKGDGLEGHNFGNLLITALERITGDFEEAIEEAGRILDVQGRVIPVTLTNTRLFAELEDGTIIRGETNIDVPKHNAELKIKRVFLEPEASANPRALDAIREANLIVIGPGDLYTSIVPNLLVKDIARAIAGSSAKRIYVCNLMTKYGETNRFRAVDFLHEVERHFGMRDPIVTHIVVNSAEPSRELLDHYFTKERAEFVKFHEDDFSRHPAEVIARPLLREGNFIRHDPEKLAKALLEI